MLMASRAPGAGVAPTGLPPDVGEQTAAERPAERRVQPAVEYGVDGRVCVGEEVRHERRVDHPVFHLYTKTQQQLVHRPSHFHFEEK
jgi:hypothetical protein